MNLKDKTMLVAFFASLNWLFSVYLRDVIGFSGYFGYAFVEVSNFILLVTFGVWIGVVISFLDRKDVRTRKEAFRKIWLPILGRMILIWFIAFLLCSAILYFCLSY